MRIAFVPVLVASLIAAPAQASDPAVDLGLGTFVGARAKLSFGGHARARPQAALTIGPTRSSVSSDGIVRTRIGEGLTLNFVGPKPTLTLAGVRADQALGLKPSGKTDAGNKMGMSSTGWIWVGAGVAAAVVAGIILHDSYCDTHIASHCGDAE